jgi:hypothetical protein
MTTAGIINIDTMNIDIINIDTMNIDTMNEFDDMVTFKMRNELLQNSLKRHITFMRSIKKKANVDVNVNENTNKIRLVLDEIGDVFLESVVQISLPKFPNDDSLVQQLVSFKRDYVIMEINNQCTSTNIIQYSVYAVTHGSDTRVINLTRKNFMDLPLIAYYETHDDPTAIVDKAYTYQTGATRTSFQRKNTAYISNPTNDFLIALNLDIIPRPDLNFGSNVTTVTVPQDLLDLSIIIKNKAYISDAPYDKLIETASFLTIF